ncbi:MAG: Asp-tRNA(Asn)/Glu-tRNA(Gln) amidotransferase subunit GatC [Armatimonadota bacterium]
MAERLTQKEIAHVARLARLQLDPDEMQSMEKHLNGLMGQFEKLQELDTSNVEPTAHSFPVYNVLRDDKAEQGLTPEQVVANAPEKRDGMFIVPLIVDSEAG